MNIYLQPGLLIGQVVDSDTQYTESGGFEDIDSWLNCINFNSKNLEHERMRLIALGGWGPEATDDPLAAVLEGQVGEVPGCHEWSLGQWKDYLWEWLHRIRCDSQ